MKPIQLTTVGHSIVKAILTDIIGRKKVYETRDYKAEEFIPADASDYDAHDLARCTAIQAREAAEADAISWANANGYRIASF